jgi:hypothetical protein
MAKTTVSTKTAKRRKPEKALRATTSSVKRAPRATPVLQPTERGRELLTLIAEQRVYGHDDWGQRPDSELKYTRLGDRIAKLGRSILRTRVATLCDVVDRAILSAWLATPDDGLDRGAGAERLFGSRDYNGFHAAAVLGVLKLAGLKLEQCNTYI